MVQHIQSLHARDETQLISYAIHFRDGHAPTRNTPLHFLPLGTREAFNAHNSAYMYIFLFECDSQVCTEKGLTASKSARNGPFGSYVHIACRENTFLLQALG